jgi:hypothetical protein
LFEVGGEENILIGDDHRFIKKINLGAIFKEHVRHIRFLSSFEARNMRSTVRILSEPPNYFNSRAMSKSKTDASLEIRSNADG